MKLRAVALLIVLSLLGSGCSRSYTSQYQAFPPGTAPHEQGWSHLCQVTTWAQHSDPISRKGPKKIEVKIKDNTGKNLLNDELKVVSAGTRPKISWTKFEEIQIAVYEEGNKFAEDEYNRLLVINGPRLLLDISYIYNQSTGKFERRSLTP